MYKIICFLFILFFISGELFAEEAVPNSADILDDLKTYFIEELNKWHTRINGYAMNLFISLATINFLARFILSLIEGSDIQKAITNMTKFMFVTGFFYLLLLKGIIYAQFIVNGLIDISHVGAGMSSNRIGVESILEIGWELITDTLANLSFTNVPESLVKIILGFATYFILLLIVANYIVESLSVWLMVYLGYFLLAFGGTEWTRDVAISYYRTVVAGGIRLMVIIFMVGLCVSSLKAVSGHISADSNATMIYAFTISLLLLMLMTKLPDAIANMISSSWGNMSSVNLASGIAAAATALKMGNTVVKSMSNGGLGVKDALKGTKDPEGNEKGNSGSGASYHLGKGIGTLGKSIFSENKGNETLGGGLGKPTGDSSSSPFNDSKSMSKTGDDK